MQSGRSCKGAWKVAPSTGLAEISSSVVSSIWSDFSAGTATVATTGMHARAAPKDAPKSRLGRPKKMLATDEAAELKQLSEWRDGAYRTRRLAQRITSAATCLEGRQRSLDSRAERGVAARPKRPECVLLCYTWGLCHSLLSILTF